MLLNERTMSSESLREDACVIRTAAGEYDSHCTTKIYLGNEGILRHTHTFTEPIHNSLDVHFLTQDHR